MAEQTFALSGTVNIQTSDSRPVDLGRTVVFLEEHPSLRPRDIEGERPQIEQIAKEFIPNLLVVSRGTTVEFPNRDPYTHNVFSRSSNAAFDLDRYPQGVSKSYTFHNIGIVQLLCNIHPNMRAIVVVVPNHHFARADRQGRFALPKLPSGEYSLVAWHALAGAQRQTIEVGNHINNHLAISLVARPRRLTRSTARRRPAPAGVERGLGVRRERLNLPVVRESHVAPQSSP